ncbi:hypothetical protein [uncultured Pseudokineococcus sp.]|uniref:hypothetical protein n=1 Tax=uncultured Pseudokineococcus sp. TaxID=1642928 RepID=UPI00262329E7|nr:hypothetical protein [uncultured Pseudokineococcus sp.]
MRARHLAPAAPLLLLLSACSASVETGTDREPDLISQAPAYEVVSEETTDAGTAIEVSIDEEPVELGVEAIVADLQGDRSEDGVYSLTVLCEGSDEELATADWAQGEDALAESGLDTGEIDTEVAPDATCGA